MTAVGRYRLALHPDADARAFEELVGSLEAQNVLQLTRTTSSFQERLFEVAPRLDDDSPRHPRPQYDWEITIAIVTGGHRYDFAASADRVQRVVGEFATVISVEALRPVGAHD